MIIPTKRRVVSICILVSLLGIVAATAAGARLPRVRARLPRVDRSKHAVKTVTNDHGDIYDCVDFYKQPAFDHPLLKNHSFHPQMKPSFQHQTIRNTNTNDVSSKKNVTVIDIAPLKDGGCPQGTVPVRRINKNNDISITNIHRKNRSSNAYIPNDRYEDIAGAIYALGQTNGDNWEAYHGVGAVISIYNPELYSPLQYTSGEIILKGGTDTIIAGWTVNPQKYGDYKTRFFAYTTAGDMHCFNAECGFVSVNKDYPIDLELQPVSHKGGDIFENKFFIYRDWTLDIWWLQFGMNGPPITMGFWPQKIFLGLAEPATYAACGGEVYTPAGVHPPDMGTGSSPQAFFDDFAYCRDFVVVNESNYILDAKDTKPYANSQFYGVFDQPKRDDGHFVLFGGPSSID